MAPFHPVAGRAVRLVSERGQRRLRRVSRHFLRREPTPGELAALAPGCESSSGYAACCAHIAFSPEARGRAGWLSRLIAWPSAGDPPPLAVAPRARTAPPAGDASDVAPVPGQAVGINLVGFLSSEIGLGEAARSMALACTAAGVPFSAVDVTARRQPNDNEPPVLAAAQGRRFPVDMLYVNADTTAPVSARLAAAGLTSRYTIGFWHWEQTTLPRSALAAFDLVDEVWVPSTFIHDCVAKDSPVPVFKVPHALQLSVTPGVRRAAFGLPEDRFLALVMYDFNSYQHRKNPQAAVAAFRRATRGRTDLGLVIKTINSHRDAAGYAALKAEVADLPHVFFIDAVLTRQQVWDLEACCDVLLSLHRAEGFGLGPAEMMFLGRPVIATGWSANMDFMTAENSMPVRYTLQPLAQRVGVYEAGLPWAEADVDHAAWCLVQLADDPALRERLGTRAAADVRAQLGPAAVGARVRARLSALAAHDPTLAVGQAG